MEPKDKCKDTEHNFAAVGNENTVKIFCTKCGEVRDLLNKS